MPDAVRAPIGWAAVLYVALTQGHPITAQDKQQHVLMIHVSSLGAPGPASFGAEYQKILGDAYDRHDPQAARHPPE